MKRTWGTGLVIAFLIFVAGILVMVTIAMNRDVDLVTEDYYQQELRHEKQIQTMKRSNAFGEGIRIVLSGSVLQITLPPQFHADSTKGTLTFYRPADRTKDFVVAINLDSTRSQQVQTSSLEKGLWRVKARWSLRDQEYFREEPIIVQ